MSKMLVAVAASLLLQASVRAQNPTRYPVDPGPLVADPTTGIFIPAGYRLTELFSTLPTIPYPYAILAKSGDLYLTSIDCTKSTTHIYRVPMQNGEPVKPIEFVQVTKQPGDFMSLAEDSTGRLFAAGNCLLSSNLYRILPDGSAVVHNKQDLHDPEIIAIGTPPNSTQERIYSASYDKLIEIDIETGETKLIPVDLSAVNEPKLGSWLLTFDPVSRSILGSRSGSNANRSIEIDLTTGKAKALAPGHFWASYVDGRGVRYFSDHHRVGLVDDSATPSRFVPLMTNLAALEIAMYSAPNGGIYLVSAWAHKVYRLDPVLHADSLVLTAKNGGTISMQIDAGAVRGNQPYFLLAALTGSTPGTQIGSALLPMNFDGYTWIAAEVVLANKGGSIMVNWMGNLDQNGRALATLSMPPALPQFRLTMNLCAYFYTGLPGSSNAIWFHILAPL